MKKKSKAPTDNENNKPSSKLDNAQSVDSYDEDNHIEGDTHSDNKMESDHEEIKPMNKIVTDLEQLEMRMAGDQKYQEDNMTEEDINVTITSKDFDEARLKWSQLEGETNSLARRLCEKLRLVLEPLVTSKLRGDYRTGKQINMKRVISYIASGYRKDKIWLRRTKPGKRDYRVLLAVDNSESMRRGSGDVALAALATLANGMNQLDIGTLGIASFGEEMKLLHSFNSTFTTRIGAEVVSNFKFKDKRTRTALCVESALIALDEQTHASSSMQILIIISDGRIERDSRDQIRKLVCEMIERNILPVMIIVEEQTIIKSKDSIVNMKEVSFEKGIPKVKYFIEDYPFPYYLILQDMYTLPEVLGDALKQWFEMMGQNQR